MFSNLLIMRIFLMFIFLTCSVVQAQTNREILDKLEELEFDREMREIEREARKRPQKYNQPLPPITYSESVTQKELNAKQWNLTYSEYVRRDEIGEAVCGRKYSPGTSQWANCWRAIILNISESEVEVRDKRAKAKCSKLGLQQQRSCNKDIMVFNK